jgi:putative DNA primase/helicase
MSRLLQALREHGIEAPKGHIESGCMHRWGHNNRYWARRFNGGHVFGDFVEDLSTHVFDKDDHDYSKSELRALRASMEKARKEAEEEQRRINEEASVRARGIWNQALPLISHSYLSEKRVQSYGLKQDDDGTILIPAYDENGKMWSLQRICQVIDEKGEKQFIKKFMYGSKSKGCYFVIGKLEESEQIFICEGYATGATIYECTDMPVVVAFSCSNLRSVAEKIRAKYKTAKIVICADNDQFHKSGTNPGLRSAEEAAKAIGASIVMPEFKDISSKPTDFNDLFKDEGIDAVKEALQKVVTPGVPLGFHVTNDGLFYSEKGKELKRISNYIKVLAFTKNEKRIARLVEFKDYKNRILKTILHPSMFSKGGDQVRVHLDSLGFVYSWNTMAKSKLVEYLSDSIPDREVLVASHTGFCGDTRVGDVYVRPDQIIGEAKEEIVLDESLHDKGFGMKGSLSDWRDNQGKYCENNSRLTFSVSAAFSSILLHVCEVSNVGFHLCGKSASGKSTCLSVASSVFGSPQYVVSWNTTGNAIENTAFRRNDALLILDELSEVSPLKVGEIAYMLANGKGKHRMNKNCESREVLEWRLVFLSSGEKDLSEHMAEANKASKAGQKVRLLSIPAKVEAIGDSESSVGIFEDLHGFKDVPEFSKHLSKCSRKYYGAVSVEFTKRVIEKMESIRYQYEGEYRKLKSEHLPDKSEGQDLRAFERFMFVGFAGELATEYGITGWKPGASYDAALKCFNAWLEEKGGVGDDENKQILEQAKAFFELHGCSRFYDLDGMKDQKVINMAGYKTSYQDAVTFYVSPSSFQNEICRGFSRKTVIDLLIKHRFLQQDHKGDYRQQKYTPHGNKKVYVVSGRILL